MINKSDIHLYTGPVRSGKSSRLLKSVTKQIGMYGFLCLERDGLRMLYNIEKASWHTHELSSEHNVKAVDVGPYKFSASSFSEASAWVVEGGRKPWLIIDELGKLELRAKGHVLLLESIFKDPSLFATEGICIVVRDDLVKQAIIKFKLDHSNTFSGDDFPWEG